MRSDRLAARSVWPAAWHRVNEPRTRRALVMDAVLWAVLSLVLVLGVFLQGSPGIAWLELVVGVPGLAAAVALSRVYPLASFLIAAGLSVLQLWGVWQTSFWPTGLVLATAVMAYLVGRRMRPWIPVLAVTAASAAVVAAVSVALPLERVPWANLAALFLLLGVLPWLVGRNLRQRADLAAAGWQRAEQLEREQRIVAEQARLRERWRIARDMHDSLGHELSLIALQAGGLELATDLDEQHRATAGRLRAAATAATDRLRDVIGILRDGGGDDGDDGDAAAPLQPGDETVADLVERARLSGMAVRLDRENGAAQPPPQVDRTAYRVVQESLTNTAKHAPAAAVTVRLRHGRDETVVTVVNEAPRAAVEPEAGGSGGRGLTGLRERVRLAGGQLQAGTRGGGFEVVAWLPHDPDAAARGAPASKAAGRAGGGPS